ncbi:type II toxin-antitoxin system YoeB family toxin [Streptomyces acidiscabies]|nr:type II toxin-antitoxin system YoeB family toxin [Streptomyces acidiscabies]
MKITFSSRDWSRRVNDEHRLIYKATEDGVLVAQCRYHYEN